MESSSIEITRLDHHGLVSSIIEEINLVEIIDSRVKNHGNREVSVGHCVKAMIINGLGFTTRVLYLTPNFFKDKLIDLLVGPGITAESLNKDSLSSALDALYEYGLSKLFMKGFLIKCLTFLKPQLILLSCLERVQFER
jgi:transposase